MSLTLQGVVGRPLRSHTALTTAMTVLIILVVAVLLAAVVAVFAINVTGTRAQEQSLLLTNPHVWYDSQAGVSESVLLIENTGGRDVIIEKVTVRGQTVNWSKTFYYTGTFSLASNLTFIEGIAEGSLTPISDGSGSFEALVAAHGDLPLPSGESMIVYVKNPDSISIGDIGLTVAINVFTPQAIYYKEANVQAYVQSSAP